MTKLDQLMTTQLEESHQLEYVNGIPQLQLPHAETKFAQI